MLALPVPALDNLNLTARSIHSHSHGHGHISLSAQLAIYIHAPSHSLSIMYRRSDPRWNRTIQHISENLEHANETAAENLYGFTTRYVNPCLASLTTCCNTLTAPCFPSTDDLRRRQRARSRGRAELSFDFYDDWEEDERDGLLGWGNESLERFLGAASN